jgi:hypothetical protein
MQSISEFWWYVAGISFYILIAVGCLTLAFTCFNSLMKAAYEVWDVSFPVPIEVWRRVLFHNTVIRMSKDQEEKFYEDYKNSFKKFKRFT